MPHKRDPVGATLARACAESATAHAGVLERALVGEHARAEGVWEAEPTAAAWPIDGGPRWGRRS